MLSIIVPTYNREKFIEKCLRSLSAQTYRDLEILVVDDGSTDETVTICKRLAEEDSRIRLIETEHAGVTPARKRGVEEARGEIIGFVDSDDWVEPDYFALMMAEMEDGVDLVVSGYTIQEEERANCYKNPIGAGVYSGEERITYLLKNMFSLNDAIEEGMPQYLWNKFFQRKMFCEVISTLNSRISYAEDVVILLGYLSRCEKIKITESLGYHHCLHEGNIYRLTDKDFFLNLDAFYKNVLVTGRETPYEEIIQNAVQREIAKFLELAVREKLGFSKEISATYIPRRLGLERGKIIVIYGAGEVGKDYVKLLKRRPICRSYLWVDSNYRNFSEELEIQSPEILKETQFDELWVAVLRDHQVTEIVSDLRWRYQIPEEKIFAEKPIDGRRLLW